MNYGTEKYVELLAETVPGVIETEAEYERIEEIFDRLISKGENRLSPEESRLFALLANLLEDYEHRIVSLLSESLVIRLQRQEIQKGIDDINAGRSTRLESVSDYEQLAEKIIERGRAKLAEK